MRKYIFVGRNGDLWSQMAAAIFNKLADPRSAYAVPVGINPAPAVHPAAITVLGEKGVRLASTPPLRLTPGIAQGADVLVALGCGDDVALAPGMRRIDWPTLDSKSAPLERIRAWRDEVCSQVRRLVKEDGVEDRRAD